MPPPRDVQAQYLEDLRLLGEGSPVALVAGVAAAVADRHGLAPGAFVERFGVEPAPVPALPDALAQPDLLGAAYEYLLGGGERRARGAHYTPRAVADGLARLVVRATGSPPLVCDPALGGGAFLLAAGRALQRDGVPCHRVVGDLLFGADVDPIAVAVADAALALWSGKDGPAVWAGEHLVVADALTLDAERRLGSHRFDVVIGNPPFASPLDAGGPSAVETRRARQRLAADLGPYTDQASMFLLVGERLVLPSGRLAMLQPESFLAARDAAPVRALLLERSALYGVWVADESVFDADVRVCVPIVDMGASATREVRRWTGAAFSPAAPARAPANAESWAHLVADLRGVPRVDPALATEGTLADLCTISAGFRDEYYGLLDGVADVAGEQEPPGPRLVTVGVIDPAACHWGHRSVRFGRQAWRRPWVDVGRLTPRIRRWVEARLVPKVVMAPQGSIIEAAVDEAGEWVASTPLVTLRAEPPDLWRLAAALLAPPVSALAHSWGAGTGLGRNGVRLTVAQVGALPLPADHDAWRQGARFVAEASAVGDEAEWRRHLGEASRVMTEAYGVDADHPVVDWWLERLPGWRRPPTSVGAFSVPSAG